MRHTGGAVAAALAILLLLDLTNGEFMVHLIIGFFSLIRQMRTSFLVLFLIQLVD